MYPTLHYFLRNYFHQDWMVDSSSSRHVVKKFIDDESAEAVGNLHRDIDEILALKSLPESLIHDWGGNYNPKVDGLSVREWLESVRAWLEAGS